ncbi:hypothetical protein Dimus_003038 [Dionaea muscipula]
MDAGASALTDEDRGEARVFADIEGLPAESQVSNDGVTDDLGSGSGVDGDVLCYSSSLVSSSPLPFIEPAAAAVLDRGEVASMPGECGQRDSSSGLRFGPLVSGSEDRAAGFLAGKQVVADVVQQVPHVLADNELLVETDCVQHDSVAMVLLYCLFALVYLVCLHCFPLLIMLLTPPSSPVEPMSERVEMEKGIHGGNSGTQKIPEGVPGSRSPSDSGDGD